ncbi:proton-conducting transporter membrane subunit [Humitalea sp. 24SJ18S-53]|uniref:proton-conducting transporter transmembrane domain-containing protein n=1 Tax=Humitalea sp. 24SJ18S-53 TaxID=3422307 RepID=UPI003D678055
MLNLLVLLVAALLALGVAGAVRHGLGRFIAAGCLAVAAGFSIIAIAALATAGADTLILALGPPGAAFTLALDHLSAWFLLLLGLAGMAASVFAMADAQKTAPRVVAAYPLFLAAMAITLLAADGLTLLLGFEAMSFASWVLVAHGHVDPANRLAARLYLSFALTSGVLIAAALALWAAGGGVSFAALRAAPPEGWRAAAILLLVLAGAGSKAGLVPLHGWLPLAHPAAPGHVSALMSAAMVKIAIYVMARLLLDCAGPSQPLWWGVPLIAAGAASAVLGALRAALEEDTKVILACSTIENVGLIVAALGLAAVLRAADLGALSALAMGAALLHALGHAVFKCGLFLAAAAVLTGAGSRRLDSLGGLIHAMPVTAAACLAMAASAAALPPLAGFSGEWMLLQSLLAGWRVGPLPMQVGLAATVALVGLAAALAAAAMVRFWGLVFLGRPRGPRSAAALEAPPLARAALVGCAAASVLFGLIPGPLLALADGAVRQAVRHGPGAQAGYWAIWPGDGATAYAAPVIAVLLAVTVAAIVWAVGRRSPAGHAIGPAWGCGFIPPGPELPFGDPLAQPSAAGLAQPLRRMLGATLLGAREQVTMPEPGDPAPASIQAGFADPSFTRLLEPLARLRDRLADKADRLRDMTLRQCLSLTFGAVVALLALVAWLESGA